MEPHKFVPKLLSHFCQECNQLKNDAIHTGRVEFVKAGGEFLGNQETYFATAHYATHSVLWHVQMTDVTGDEVPEVVRDVYDKIGFQDREGHWWLVWSSFYHMKESAEKAIKDEIAFRNLDFYGQVWIGEL